jgi:TatD DNase family protein
MLIDTHAHLDMPEFDRDRNEVIKRANDDGIDYIVTVGIDLDSCKDAVRLSEQFEFIYAIVGMHPHNAKDVDEKSYDILREYARHDKVRGLGEMGLDFFRNHSPREVQLKRFREQVALAREVHLPVIIHDRDAHRETLAILKEGKASEVGGVIHCFSGDYAMASTCMDMGFYISIPGTVTFTKAQTLQEVVRRIPLERILIETDCPFLAPVPFRGKRNEPAYVQYVARAIADIKKVSFETVAAETSDNARSVFGIPSPKPSHKPDSCRS